MRASAFLRFQSGKGKVVPQIWIDIVPAKRIIAYFRAFPPTSEDSCDRRPIEKFPACITCFAFSILRFGSSDCGVPNSCCLDDTTTCTAAGLSDHELYIHERIRA